MAVWLCGGTRRCLAFLVEQFSSNQAVSVSHKKKKSVNRLFFLLSKAPLFTPSAGRGGWYPILGHLGFFFRPSPPRGGGRGCHTSPKILIPQPGPHPTPVSAIWGPFGAFFGQQSRQQDPKGPPKPLPGGFLRPSRASKGHLDKSK